MISTFKTFSVNKAIYTSLKKYVQVIGTSLLLVMSATLLSVFMAVGLGLSSYGLSHLILAYRLDMSLTVLAALKALFFVASMIGFGLVYGALMAGITKASLDLYKTGSAHVGTLISRFNNAGQVALAMLLVCIAGFLGLFFLVIPGLIIFLRTMLTLYFIVDQDMTAVEAIKASWNATRGNALKLCGILFVLSLMSYSFSVLAMPLSWFVFAYIYEALSGRENAS